MNTETGQLVRSVFEKIPGEELLAIAADIRMKGHQNAVQKAGQGEYGWVTEADLLIEKHVLAYFAASPLSGSYFVRSEEGGAAESRDPQWQLILDPIDGTAPYRRGENEWGVMVGAADLDGRIFYSWNLLSTGELYRTGDRSRSIGEWEEAAHLKIDVCDYDAGARSLFPAEFSRISGIDQNRVTASELPAAVWVGGELWKGALNGMLWLPSDSGKRFYPSHDLIFIGALKQAGFTIRLGHISNENAFLVAAPSSKRAEQLWNCGKILMKPHHAEKLIETNPLQIVRPFGQ